MFPHSYKPMGRLFDTTGEAAGAGPTILHILQGTGPLRRANAELFISISIIIQAQ